MLVDVNIKVGRIHNYMMTMENYDLQKIQNQTRTRPIYQDGEMIKLQIMDDFRNVLSEVPVSNVRSL